MIHAKGKLIFLTSTENQLESNPSHISVPLKYDYFKIVSLRWALQCTMPGIFTEYCQEHFGEIILKFYFV